MWLLWLESSRKPATTLYLRGYHLRRFSQHHRDRSPWEITDDDAARWLTSFDWAVETTRSYLASLRSFYSWAHAKGLILANPIALLPAITPPAGKPRPAPEQVFRNALLTALQANDRRLWLMLMLAGTEGLRRGEICQVHTNDVELDTADGGWNLRVHGKGRKIRIVPLIDELSREIRRMPPGFLFPGRIDGHLSPAYVGKLISAALPEGITAHPLRHRFAGKAYELERDIRAVQELLGHTSVRTTQIYTPVPVGALRSAVHAAA
jgi:integrase